MTIQTARSALHCLLLRILEMYGLRRHICRLNGNVRYRLSTVLLKVTALILIRMLHALMRNRVIRICLMRISGIGSALLVRRIVMRSLRRRPPNAHTLLRRVSNTRPTRRISFRSSYRLRRHILLTSRSRRRRILILYLRSVSTSQLRNTALHPQQAQAVSRVTVSYMIIAY